MNGREIAEKLYLMAMDLDWMDYEDTREETIQTLADEIENAGENLRQILERIIPED